VDERSARPAANEAVFRLVVEEAASFTIIEKRGAERAIVERSDIRAS